VLDEHLEPCPVGVDGMLYIGGLGVAMGYYGEEELTRQAYITHPRWGERLYRTGDLGRYQADGTIEFLGRRDFQVKIRGFRIELGEIESALGQHPSVREAVVLAREWVHGGGSVAKLPGPADKRLVAYLVAREAPLPGVSELRSYLQSKLPE